MKWTFYGLPAVATTLLLGQIVLAEPDGGYQAEVTVTAETRLDWIFALANQSRAEPPADWLADYDSTAQRYELFVPPKVNPRKPAPLVLFISPGGQPTGWDQFQTVCRQSGVIFASPFAAGNDCPLPRRVKIVLDVLDDVRRRQAIDPDRTYLAGFSGGARIACAMAFALPEYFGGVVAVCGAERLRPESWLRQRVVDRLSVALVTGDGDFNRGELERYRGPLLEAVGVRAKVWTVPKLGHAIPDERRLAEVFAWLEVGTADRRRQAKQWPAMRIAAGAAPSRDEWAAALLKEARGRLEKPKTLFSGLMQLIGISTRWADLQAGEEARQLLEEYDAKSDRPWENDDLAEQRRFLIAEARGLDRYASGPLADQYANQRGAMASQAIKLWQQVADDDPDSAAGKEAKERIVELERLTGESKEP